MSYKMLEKQLFRFVTTFLPYLMTKVTGIFPSSMILLQLKLIIKLIEFSKGAIYPFFFFPIFFFFQSSLCFVQCVVYHFC